MLSEVSPSGACNHQLINLTLSVICVTQPCECIVQDTIICGRAANQAILYSVLGGYNHHPTKCMFANLQRWRQPAKPTRPATPLSAVTELHTAPPAAPTHPPTAPASTTRRFTVTRKSSIPSPTPAPASALQNAPIIPPPTAKQIPTITDLSSPDTYIIPRRLVPPEPMTASQAFEALPPLPETYVISTRVRRPEPLSATSGKTKRAIKAKLKVPDEQLEQNSAHIPPPEPEAYVIPKRQLKLPDEQPDQTEAKTLAPAPETYTIAKRIIPSEPVPEGPVSLERTPKAQLKLRDYQEECIAAVMTAYEEGSMAQIIEMPTGVFLHGLSQWSLGWVHGSLLTGNMLANLANS